MPDNYTLEKIDIDKNRDLTNDYEVEYYPTIVFLKDNKEIYRIAGKIVKQDLIEAINKIEEESNELI